MSMLHDGLLGTILGETPSTQYDIGATQEQSLREYMLGLALHQPQQLGAMQRQQMPFDPLALQIQQARAMQPYSPETPKCKKVESKIIETVEIRPEQDVKLLKAGESI